MHRIETLRSGDVPQRDALARLAFGMASPPPPERPRPAPEQSVGAYDGDRLVANVTILADALQDAGCDNDDMLNHCRDEKQVHARGCWVVDLLLGKE